MADADVVAMVAFLAVPALAVVCGDVGRFGDMAGYLTSEEEWDVDAATDRSRTHLTTTSK